MSDDNPNGPNRHGERAPLKSGILRRPRRVRDSTSERPVASATPAPVSPPAAPPSSAGGGFWASRADVEAVASADTAPSVPDMPPVPHREAPHVKPEPSSRPSLQSVQGRSGTERTWLDSAMDSADAGALRAPEATSTGLPSSNAPGVSGGGGAVHAGTHSGLGQRADASHPPVSDLARSEPAEVSGVGLQLPGYRMLKLLGKGGMGEVCLAERISSAGVPVKCVVKTILPHASRNQQYRELFLDEARLVSHLRHPNVVTVMECGQQGEVLYQAIEWIEGLDASALMERANAQTGGIPLPHLLYILREVLQGLHYAHTAVDHEGIPLHIVHRDISPGNVLISRQGAVKLADFGVAVGTASHTEGARESLAGKPHYFAPELWKGSQASPATDVFSLAVSFYELLSGHPLFDRSKSLRALAYEICHFTPEALLQRDLTIPEGIETIIHRSLAPDPVNRYASALEFLEDVNDYAYEYGIRLLDAHFARYIERVLGGGDRSDGRRHLFAGGGDDT